MVMGYELDGKIKGYVDMSYLWNWTAICTSKTGQQYAHLKLDSNMHI